MGITSALKALYFDEAWQIYMHTYVGIGDQNPSSFLGNVVVP